VRPRRGRILIIAFVFINIWPLQGRIIFLPFVSINIWPLSGSWSRNTLFPQIPKGLNVYSIGLVRRGATPTGSYINYCICFYKHLTPSGAYYLSPICFYKHLTLSGSWSWNTLFPQIPKGLNVYSIGLVRRGATPTGSYYSPFVSINIWPFQGLDPRIHYFFKSRRD